MLPVGHAGMCRTAPFPTCYVTCGPCWHVSYCPIPDLVRGPKPNLTASASVLQLNNKLTLAAAAVTHHGRMCPVGHDRMCPVGHAGMCHVGHDRMCPVGHAGMCHGGLTTIHNPRIPVSAVPLG